MLLNVNCFTVVFFYFLQITHWCLVKMVTTLQRTVSNPVPWMKFFIIKISLKFVLEQPINNKSALVKVMARWWRCTLQTLHMQCEVLDDMILFYPSMENKPGKATLFSMYNHVAKYKIKYVLLHFKWVICKCPIVQWVKPDIEWETKSEIFSSYNANRCLCVYLSSLVIYIMNCLENLWDYCQMS